METPTTPQSPPTHTEPGLIALAIAGLGAFAAKAITEGLGRLFADKEAVGKNRHQGPLFLTLLMALFALVVVMLVTARKPEPPT